MIEENVKNLMAEIPEFNPFGEKITLVAAVKFQTPESINAAISAGIRHIGDNHVQEFRDKFSLVSPTAKRHFIGRLQTNKVKYLIGKTDLYQSVDRYNLAEEISKKSAAAGITSEILLQVNIGNEEQKGGFSDEELNEAYTRIAAMPALKISGLMAMLPLSDDENRLRELAHKMRVLYDGLREKDGNFRYLSMGMSGDWKLCIEEGANLIRLGTAIFGERRYN